MDFRVPELGEGIYEAELVTWRVQPGQDVKRGDSLAEVLTDKASMELPSPFAGTIKDLQVEEGQPIKVGNVILSYQPVEGEEAAASETAVVEETAPAENGVKAAPAAAATAIARPRTDPAPTTGVRAAPSVRLMARQMGLDLRQIRGSGPGGRVLVKDLTAKVQAEVPSRPAPPMHDFGTAGTRIKFHGLRRRIAEHLVQSVHTIPHYTYVDECDVTDLLRLRESLKDTFAAANVRLSYVAFMVKAVVAALKEVPIVNSTLDEAAGEIVLHDAYHIGLAVAAPAGLIVPVIHDADRKDVGQISSEIEHLSEAARAGKLRLEELRGGTFTVSSIGSVGGMIATPIIHQPQVGIVGVGKFVRRPIYDAQGNLRPADLMFLSFSFDHRVVDGAVGAVFGNAVIRRLQNPGTLLLPT